MSQQITNENLGIIGTLVRAYSVLILATLGLAPSFAIAYLHVFQDPALRFENYTFHETAIAVAVLQSGFIAWVTWRCFLASGEVFLRWLTIGFLAFTIIYSMHGILTPMSQVSMMHFIIFGPVSRFVMAGCFFIGSVMFGRYVVSVDRRNRSGFWLTWIGALFLITILTYLIAGETWAGDVAVIAEVASLTLMVGSLAVIGVKRLRSPLILIFALSLLFFSQSSVAFLLGSPWNHQWWLAHATFAAGFIGLSYGVIQSFLTTRSFSRVYSQTELMERVRAEQTRAEDALRDLKKAHSELQKVATTDPLTGIANRRVFIDQAAVEMARSSRSGVPLSLVMMDIDRFKEINDSYGHQIGDEVLKEIASRAKDELRGSDLLGRYGGEEFVTLLPDTTKEQAGQLAERLRKIIEAKSFGFDGVELKITASFGVAEFGGDGSTYEDMINIADQRLYKAKRDGRNQVVTA
jgi:diguanylate cyclase (GGDEF)-like protein